LPLKSKDCREQPDPWGTPKKIKYFLLTHENQQFNANFDFFF
jgi:hypothetical protein